VVSKALPGWQNGIQIGAFAQINRRHHPPISCQHGASAAKRGPDRQALIQKEKDRSNDRP
jgi:hypothetical protein